MTARELERPVVAELLARARFDFLDLALEAAHRLTSQRSSSASVATSSSASPTNQPISCCRKLDDLLVVGLETGRNTESEARRLAMQVVPDDAAARDREPDLRAGDLRVEEAAFAAFECAGRTARAVPMVDCERQMLSPLAERISA